MKSIRKIHATATEWYVFVPTGECVRAFSKARAIESFQAFNPTFQVGESNVLLESEYNQRLTAGQLEIE